nr:hypothetical protein [Tanacetum cinerariifolium]GEW37798.1 hypothetical protein [Tanacetum cinerariifolium]
MSTDESKLFEPNYSGFDQPQQYFIDHQEDLNQQQMNNVHNTLEDKTKESHNELLNMLKLFCENILRQREKAANLSINITEPSCHLNSFCYDDDDDDDEEKTIPLNDIISQLPPSIVITTSPPVLPIKDPKDLVPIPSESEDTSENDSECILPSCDDFSPITVFKEKSDVLEYNVKIYSNPLFEFDDEYISSDVNPLFNEVLENIEIKDSYDSNLDEPDLLVTPLFDVDEDKCFDPRGDFDETDAFLDINTSMDVKDGYHDSEGDIIYLESLLTNETIPSLPFEIFLDHDPKSLKDESVIDDSKNMVKIFDPGIHDQIVSPTYVSLPFEERHYLFFTHVV